MENILISWIGGNDLNAAEPEEARNGPILSTLDAHKFSKSYLIYNYSKKKVTPYINWLKTKTDTEIEATVCKLSSPIDYGDIYEAANSLLDMIFTDHPADSLCILLSPGTPTMQAVWVLLGKTKYPVTFYQSSLEQGVQQVEIPFDISAEFLPEHTARSAKQISALAAGEAPIHAAFDDILTKNPHMEKLKAQATVIATSEVPALVYGETGTGKELFARAIHNASSRSGESFVPVNCGAIPPDLIDSTLFGYVKGAFTGATKDKDGYFSEADNGTIFLDEFGELPLDAQVRLLRVLQNGEVMPVGGSKPITVDVRVIAATNRNLLEEVSAGRFREDLFYRVAVGMLYLPPLRDRKGDLIMLAEALLEQINQKAASRAGYKSKKISAKAKNIILKHPWMGNVRELHSTLLRASLWATTEQIDEQDISEALYRIPEASGDILDRDLNESFDIQSVIDEVQVHYIERALADSAGKKKKAAELLGLTTYQTLSNWMEKHGIK